MRWINLMNKRCIFQCCLERVEGFKLQTIYFGKDVHMSSTDVNSSQKQTIVEPKWDKYIVFCKEYDESAKDMLKYNMLVYEDFLNEEEETSLFQEVEPYLKKLRYEFAHWDDAIHGFRETERHCWNLKNTTILDRVRSLAFPSEKQLLSHVHVLDLSEKGYIKPHVDSARFCGNTIAGLSLLSDSVMRLNHEKEKKLYADFFLKRRSLYIMKGVARYDYNHEILQTELSVFQGVKVERGRRISIICRNKPETVE